MSDDRHHDPRSDAELIRAINAGDVEAFAALYRRHRDWTVRLARRFTHHEADALDVVQETFAYLLRRSKGLYLATGMTTFLYPVVKNLSIAANRKRRRHADAGLDTSPPATTPPDTASRSDLAAALASLPEAQREVLLLRFVDDLTLDEIAQALSIPLGTVKSRLHNALAQLRDDPRARQFFES